LLIYYIWTERKKQGTKERGLAGKLHRHLEYI